MMVVRQPTHKKKWVAKDFRSIVTGSMDGSFAYIELLFLVGVGKYVIHESDGI